MSLLEDLKKFKKQITHAGIIRKLDELGRVVIPIEFRKNKIENNTPVYIQRVENYVVLSLNCEDETGTQRKFDELGRIVINKEIRTDLEWNTKDSICIWAYKNYIILKKYEDKCIICGNTKDLIQFNGKLICENCKKELSEV